MTQTDPAPRSASDLWSQIRQDYLAGVSAPVLAERHGVALRTLRQRAAVESWRRRDEVSRREPFTPNPDPDLGEVVESEGLDQFRLLFDPRPDLLRRFAFRKSAEEAAMDRPQQSLVWLRLAERLDRCGDRIDEEASEFRDIDHLRAAYLRRIVDRADATSSDLEGAAPPP